MLREGKGLRPGGRRACDPPASHPPRGVDGPARIARRHHRHDARTSPGPHHPDLQPAHEHDEHPDPGDDDLFDARPGPASRRRRARQLLDGLAGDELELPTAFERQCRALKDLYGYKHEQIADVLTCRRETVSRVLKRFDEKHRRIQAWAAARRLGPEVADSLAYGRRAG